MRAKKTTTYAWQTQYRKGPPRQGGFGARGRVLHRRGEFMKTLGGDGRKEVFLIGEMAISGRRRHADAAGGLPQSNRV